MTKKSADRINLILLTALVTLALTFTAEGTALKLYDQHREIARLKLEKYDLVNNLHQVASKLQSCARAAEGY